MSDYISREEAIVALKNAYLSCPEQRERLAVEACIVCIKCIPAADVEPVRHVRLAEGDEQYVEEFGWFRWVRCLNCFRGFDITGHPRYCPYCGWKVVLEGENKGMAEAEAVAEVLATRAEQEASSETEGSSVNFDDFFASYEGTDQVDGNQTEPESDHMEAEETTTKDSDGPENVQMDLEDENNDD